MRTALMLLPEDGQDASSSTSTEHGEKIDFVVDGYSTENGLLAKNTFSEVFSRVKEGKQIPEALHIINESLVGEAACTFACNSYFGNTLTSHHGGDTQVFHIRGEVCAALFALERNQRKPTNGLGFGYHPNYSTKQMTLKPHDRIATISDGIIDALPLNITKFFLTQKKSVEDIAQDIKDAVTRAKAAGKEVTDATLHLREYAPKQDVVLPNNPNAFIQVDRLYHSDYARLLTPIGKYKKQMISELRQHGGIVLVDLLRNQEANRNFAAAYDATATFCRELESNYEHSIFVLETTKERLGCDGKILYTHSGQREPTLVSFLPEDTFTVMEKCIEKATKEDMHFPLLERLLENAPKEPQVGHQMISFYRPNIWEISAPITYVYQ